MVLLYLAGFFAVVDPTPRVPPHAPSQDTLIVGSETATTTLSRFAITKDTPSATASVGRYSSGCTKFGL